MLTRARKGEGGATVWPAIVTGHQMASPVEHFDIADQGSTDPVATIVGSANVGRDAMTTGEFVHLSIEPACASVDPGGAGMRGEDLLEVSSVNQPITMPGEGDSHGPIVRCSCDRKQVP